MQKSCFVIEKNKKYRKCPALGLIRAPDDVVHGEVPVHELGDGPGPPVDAVLEPLGLLQLLHQPVPLAHEAHLLEVT